MKLPTKNIFKIIKRPKNTNKFLSPHIFKINKKKILCFAKRLKTNEKYGEINFASLNNFKKWKIISDICIKPNKSYDSFVSPSHLYKKKINYFFIEAQKNKKSDIIMLKTKDFKTLGN